MMTRALWFGAVALAVVGCSNEQTLSETPATLEITPPLRDAGTIPVGDTVVVSFELLHKTGFDIEIQNVEVENVEGEFFFFEGPETQILANDGRLTLDFHYNPIDLGYHRATVRISHSGEDSPALLDLRGHAILPEATLWPLGVDFGPVAVGETKTKTLTVSNTSDFDLTLTEASFSNDLFALGGQLPIFVGGGDEKVVNLTFTPVDLEPASGSLTLRAGDVELPQVSLRGNDCENGTPEAYDEDGDGYTTCGGDCNDADLDVHPGAVETYDFADEDCDSIVDEGTVGYDDDGDGFCEHDDSCSDPAFTPGDCNDGAVDVNPAEVEDLSNGIDDDCDGVVDQGTTDTDFDGYSPDGGDCDDTDGTVYPGAPELADGIDNDCDFLVDEGTVVFDDDGDGYCEDPTSCTDGSIPGDCDDDTTDANGDLIPDGRPTNPGASELADWRDNDCDGTVDEGTVNYDDDADGYTEVGGDCDDADATLSPAYGNC